MPIDTKCPGCGRLLRVGDEHLGRQARCPACSTIYVVPSGQTPVEPPGALDGNPFGLRPEIAGDGIRMTMPAAVSPAGLVIPHRGGLILVLGILGWCMGCPIFSVAAWMMGSSDLREMRCGRMDPAGKGITQAGYVLGMVYSLLWLVVLVILMLVVMIGLAANVVG